MIKAALLACACLAAALAGCADPCGNEVVADVPSPSGRQRAVVFRRACGGTTGSSVQVSVIGKGERVPNEVGNVLGTDRNRAEVPLALSASWDADGTLVLLYDSRLRTVRREREVRGIRVLYATEQTTSGAPTWITPPEAEQRLVEASVFKDARVGYAGLTPPEVHAYRALLAAPDGLERFRRVMETGQPAGRLYALCGLFFLDPPAFDQGLERLRATDVQVETQWGCDRGEKSMRILLAPGARSPRMPRAWAPGALARAIEAAPEGTAFDFPGGSWCHALRDSSGDGPGAVRVSGPPEGTR